MQVTRRTFQRYLLLGVASTASSLQPSLLALPPDASSDWQDLAQPFVAQIRRLLTALEAVGEPLSPVDTAALQLVLSSPIRPDSVGRIETILARYVLVEVTINPESRVSAMRGAARADLVEHGWRSFLVRVNNQAHDTSVLDIVSPQGGPTGRPSGNETDSVHDFTIGAVDAGVAESRWIAVNCWTKPPLAAALSGLELEYRIVQIYSRDRGRREAMLEAHTGAGVQDLGFRSSVAILFNCAPSEKITLHLSDSAHVAAAAALLITDSLGRVVPTQSKRALPDLWFQPQIYRFHGETLALAPGTYTVRFGRGPEYLQKSLALTVAADTRAPLELALERWITPREMGYFSGDTHIHAAGCSHYESPSEGVTPEVMLRQVEGEALDLGAVLTWAPGFLYQSQFFSGHVHTVAPEPETAASMSSASMNSAVASRLTGPSPSPAPATSASSGESTLRYDLEVSGFPSSHCGHLVLLELQHQNYPGTTMPEDWPSWNLPILRWAKSQGAITGYAHSGHGMVVDSTQVLNDIIPAFNSCGANEYLVDVTHEGMLDFISGCDLWPFVELNLWYHVLNCGFRLCFAGETDFPCITDHCVGGGRSYVKLDAPPVGDAGYQAWLESGLQHGHSYVGDGRSHIFDFSVTAPQARPDTAGDLHSAQPTSVKVTARVGARLEPTVSPETRAIQHRSPYEQPFWHLERARIAETRSVAVELIVNGEPQQHVTIEADADVHAVSFDVHIASSSWIALRVLPSSHTNPVRVHVANKPIRASVRSAQWCRKGVDACWKQKSLRIRPSETAAASAAYEHARAAYDRIIAESLT